MASWRRRRTGLSLRVLAAVIACSTVMPAAGDADEGKVYRQAAVPGWVNQAEPDLAAPTPKGRTDASAYYLLFDRQIDVREHGDEWFEHVAIRLLNQAGVDGNSQLTFYVDPSYQRLTLHWVRIRRGAATLDRLAPAKVTIVPVESELQNRIYSGQQSVNLLIPDLRIGDVLEYAYTTDSVSPSFPEHFYAQLDYLWSSPVLAQRLRLRHRSSHPVAYRIHGGDAKPEVREYGGFRELLFSWHGLPAHPGESDVPDWYPMWPYIEFSNIGSWHEVASRTAAIYRRESVIGPLTKERIAALRSMQGSTEDRIVAALRMVQDDIQYASLSIGEGSFRPNRPDLVLERRLGDCKDKSLLLSTMLNALGIDARPALVHTRRGPALVDSLPTPQAFDHAIVRVNLEKRTYWLDPTHSLQRGTLANIVQPDFRLAMVIDAQTSELEPMRLPGTGARTQEVTTTFDLTGGITEPGKFSVTTRYLGEAADSMRTNLASRDAEQRATDYLNYYAGYYPGISSDGQAMVQDDPVGNIIVVKERYRLSSGFRTANSGQLIFEIFPDELYRFSDTPVTSIRTAPLTLRYPMTMAQTFVVRLPETWTVTPEVVTIENPSFRYRSASRYTDKVLTISYRYEALTDHVPTAQVPKYLADIKLMSDDLGYKLTYDSLPQQLKSGIAPLPLAVGLLSLVAGIWLAAKRVYRYDPAPRQAGEVDSRMAGISGWLIIPALNVLVLLGVLVYVIYAIGTYTTAYQWNSLPDAASEDFAAWAQPATAAMLGFTLFILPGSVAMAVAFFRRRTSAPILWLAVLWILNGCGFAFTALANALAVNDEPIPQWDAVAIRDLLMSVIWTAYMLRSVRVKATFVRRLQKDETAPVAGPAIPASLG